jgi:hypothetical protein
LAERSKERKVELADGKGKVIPSQSNSTNLRPSTEKHTEMYSMLIKYQML